MPPVLFLWHSGQPLTSCVGTEVTEWKSRWLVHQPDFIPCRIPWRLKWYGESEWNRSWPKTRKAPSHGLWIILLVIPDMFLLLVRAYPWSPIIIDSVSRTRPNYYYQPCVLRPHGRFDVKCLRRADVFSKVQASSLWAASMSHLNQFVKHYWKKNHDEPRYRTKLMSRVILTFQFNSLSSPVVIKCKRRGRLFVKGGSIVKYLALANCSQTHGIFIKRQCSSQSIVNCRI